MEKSLVEGRRGQKFCRCFKMHNKNQVGSLSDFFLFHEFKSTKPQDKSYGKAISSRALVDSCTMWSGFNVYINSRVCNGDDFRYLTDALDCYESIHIVSAREQAVFNKAHPTSPVHERMSPRCISLALLSLLVQILLLNCLDLGLLVSCLEKTAWMLLVTHLELCQGLPYLHGNWCFHCSDV